MNLFELERILPGVNFNALFRLAAEFRTIFETEIHVECFMEEPGKIVVNYFGKKYLFLIFNLKLHLYTSKHKSCKDHPILECPKVEISNLFISPKGQGIGTRIMKRLLAEVYHSPIKVIYLTAQSKAAARFWSRLGFITIPASGDYRPQMFLR